jgi:hypothetical protein
MPRYLVQRSAPAEVPVATSADGVTWLHSYVTPDRQMSFCIYNAPDLEALRRTAPGPADTITEIDVLDPYIYDG